ncbi:vignain-like protein [Tanacetum coccineum]
MNGREKALQETSYEFRSIYAGSKIHHHRSLQGDRIGNKTFMYANVQSVPTSIDWRKKGVVAPVKDQGQRGDSYDIDDIIVIVTIIYDKLMCFFVRVGELL